MNASKRMVNLFYAASTLLAWGIYAKTFALLFTTFAVRDSQLLGKGFTMTTLLGAAAAVITLIYTWRHPVVKPWLNEAGDELSKVVWPSREETVNNSKVVIIVTMIISAILWVFDQVFGHLTNMLLGGAA